MGPSARPIQRMENVGCEGAAVVRTRVPLRDQPAAESFRDRLRAVDRSGLCYVKKLAAAAAAQGENKTTTVSVGLQQGGTGSEGFSGPWYPIGHAAHSPPPTVIQPSPTASAGCAAKFFRRS
jgi:hypothetical protein